MLDEFRVTSFVNDLLAFRRLTVFRHSDMHTLLVPAVGTQFPVDAGDVAVAYGAIGGNTFEAFMRLQCSAKESLRNERRQILKGFEGGERTVEIFVSPFCGKYC